MIMRIAFAAFCADTLLATAASAQETRAVSVGANVSSLGVGVEAGYRINPYFGLRGGANYFSLSLDRTIDDIKYNTDFDLKSGGLVLDVFPFRGNFRISAGARINGNQADISGTPTSNVTIGNTTYTPAQVGRLNGDIDFNTVAPYVGIGFDGHITDALTIGFDLGVLYQGKPSVSLSATNPAVSQADLNRERANIEDDLKMLQFYPVATVSLKYRF
jgi:hypothetical protein